MNIIIIGLGSMGKRRIRLLKNHFQRFNIFGIDLNESRRIECEKNYSIKTFENLNDLNSNEVYCAFICTSPLSHSKIIRDCLNKGLHVFTELNLVKDGYIENIELALKMNVTLFLSSTALYRKEIEFILSKTESKAKPVIYSYHVGQYLPDWHPWEDYKNFFVKENRTNGCRELLAIELPWIIAAFGKINNINITTGKMSELDLDHNDYYLIQFSHENGSKGNLIVDIICREAVRKLEIFNESLYIEWQGKPDTLKSKNIDTKELETVNLYESIDKLESYSSTIIENQYLEEIKTFFDVIEGNKDSKYTFYDDLYTLEVIDRIEGLL